MAHAGEIIINSPVPLGLMGEEAIESRHRVYKFDREHHARKKSRETNLNDIFIQAIQTSDPLISSISLTRRLKNKKPLCLQKTVKSFFSCL